MFCYTDVVHGPVLLAQKSGIYTFLNKFYGITKWAALKFETCGRSKMAILGILVRKFSQFQETNDEHKIWENC